MSKIAYRFIFVVFYRIGARGRKENSEGERALANAALAVKSFYLLAQVLLLIP